MAEQKDQHGHRPDNLPEDEGQRKRRWDRRTFIRTGLAVGAGVVASAYVKPSLQSIGIPRAFAHGTPALIGKPSIEFDPDDVTHTVSGVGSFTFGTVLGPGDAFVKLCNVGDHHPVTIEASDWFFEVTHIDDSAGHLNTVPDSADGVADGVGLPTTFPALASSGSPPFPCAPFPVTFYLLPSWANADPLTEIKVKINASGTANGFTAVTHLTLTLVRGT